MEHIHGSYESTNRFRINPFSRAIINESELDIAIAQYDHNSERFIFELPKMVEEHDMTLCSAIRIHYINAGSSGKSNKDVYQVSDIATSEDDPDVVTFSWLLSKSATSLEGVLSFSIQFICTTDGEVDYSWSTLPFKSIKIPETYDNSDNIVEEDYSDILEQWKEELFATFEDYSMDDFAKKMSGMQKISLVGITTSNLEHGFEIYDDEIICGLTSTHVIDFKGYISLRCTKSNDYIRLLIDDKEVGSEYSGFVSENIKVVFDGVGSIKFTDLYGIPDAISEAKVDAKIETKTEELNVTLSSKANEMAGMQKISLIGITDIGRELASDEMITDDRIVVKGRPTINIDFQGYARIIADCLTTTSGHKIYIDGNLISNDSDYELYYSGYIHNGIKIRCVYHNSDIKFDFYGIPNAASKEEVNTNALISSTSGEVIHVDDVSDSPHRIVAKIGRKRNILPMPYYETSKTVNGVTIVTNDDGSIIINGTCTGALGFTIFKGSIPLKGKYTLSGVTNANAGESTHYLQPYIDDVFQTTVVNGSRTYEIDGKLTQLALYVKNGYTFNNVVVYPQLEEGSVATEYEPYINPTSMNVRVFGKNLFPPLSTISKDGITLSKVDDYYMLNGTATSSGLITTTIGLPSGRYTISANNPVHNGLDLAIVQVYSDTTKKSLVAKDNAIHSTYTDDILAANDYQFRIRYEKGVTYNNYIVKPQLELGTEATDYEAYIDRTSYTPAADGTVEIDSISPTMTVFTDTPGVNINLEYQQDHNKAMDEVRAGIKMLDDNNAILVENMVTNLKNGIASNSAHQIFDSSTFNTYSSRQKITTGNIKNEEAILYLKDNGFGDYFQPNDGTYLASLAGVPTGTFGSSSFSANGKGRANGKRSFTEGSSNISYGNNSHSEGSYNIAIGEASHAEGACTSAIGLYSHAEGQGTKASGHCAHAQGLGTEATNYGSHAQGGRTVSSGNFSHAGGVETIASGAAQTVIGRANIQDDTKAFIIGNGNNKKGDIVHLPEIDDVNNPITRSNAMTVDWYGNMELSGTNIILRDSKDTSKRYMITIENGTLKATLV